MVDLLGLAPKSFLVRLRYELKLFSLVFKLLAHLVPVEGLEPTTSGL